MTNILHTLFFIKEFFLNGEKEISDKTWNINHKDLLKKKDRDSPEVRLYIKKSI